MKIEYLSNGAQECPLIRIYGSNCYKFKQLSKAIINLLSKDEDLRVHKLSGFESINNCKLYFSLGDANENIIQHNSQLFSWTLTTEGWEIVNGLIEPFCKKTKNKFHQWISGEEAYTEFNKSPISLLISNRDDGRW